MEIVRGLLLSVRVVTSKSAQASCRGVDVMIAGSDMHSMLILEPLPARSVGIRNRLMLCRYVSRGHAELQLLRMTVLSSSIKVCYFLLHSLSLMLIL